MSERIKAAAILYGGEIYTGRRHHEIGLQMLRDGVCKAPYPSGPAQGFVTESGIFVSRARAHTIAIAAGQADPANMHTAHHLFSEDLPELDLP